MTDDTGYEVTVAIDHGDLPSGNGRKTSREMAELSIEETMDGRATYEILDTRLVSQPTFERGDTTWTVMVTVAIPDYAEPPQVGEWHIEDVEETAIEMAE